MQSLFGVSFTDLYKYPKIPVFESNKFHPKLNKYTQDENLLVIILLNWNLHYSASKTIGAAVRLLSAGDIIIYNDPIYIKASSLIFKALAIGPHYMQESNPDGPINHAVLNFLLHLD